MQNLHALEESLFAQALLQPASTRDKFLRQACGDRTELLARLTSLLEEHSRSGALDRAPGIEPGDTARQACAVAEAPGTRIGRYELREQIGEGGCGLVFRAFQNEPVRREVAFKVIKLGMDTRAVITRFEAERQALALMDHPGIARVFDGGATAAGRPYFVMELVSGIRITDYCDRQRLSVDERLRLFVQVCAAVQHAHQKGVVHRDLKPSNVLVAAPDGRPAPKVIDFGIAKAMQTRLTEHTLVTVAGQFVGTPAYMSPEQAASDGADIDTRSDIYSLGVLLYELLAGISPLGPTALRPDDGGDFLRRLREEDVVRPSTRFGSLEPAVRTTLASNRGVDPRLLVRRLRGDLDWIVLRSLEKDRTRRYETAEAFALDLERHLRNEPVAARPPHATYVLAKFARRHRVSVVAGATVVLALLAGATVSTVLYLRADADRARALAGELAARQEAQRSAQTARFMQEMFDGVNLAASRGRDTQLLRDLLRNAEERLDRELGDQPEIESDLRDRIGRAYGAMLDYERAELAQRRSFASRLRLHGPDHPKTLESLDGIGINLFYQDRRAEAAVVFRDALARRRRITPDGSVELAWAIMRVARALADEGKLDQAETLYREEMALKEKLLPPSDPRLADVRRRFASFLAHAHRQAEAETMYRSLVAQSPVDMNDHEPTSRGLLLSEFGELLVRRGKFDEAESTLRESLDLLQKLYAGDPGHPRAQARIAIVRGQLGRLYLRQERWSEAEATTHEVLARARVVLSEVPDNAVRRQDVANALLQLAEIYRRHGRIAEQATAAREALDLLRPLPLTRANRLPEALLRLGQAFAQQERWAESEPLLREALATEPRRGGEMRSYQMADGWFEALARQGRADHAPQEIPALLECAREAVRRWGLVAGSLFAIELSQVLAQRGHPAPAQILAGEMLAQWERHQPDTWQGCALHSVIGAALLAENRAAEAEPHLRAGYDGLRRHADRLVAGSSDLTGFARRSLEQLLLRTGRTEQAAALTGPRPAAGKAP